MIKITELADRVQLEATPATVRKTFHRSVEEGAMLCTDWSGGGHTLRRQFPEKTRLHRPVDINVTGYDEPATTASGAWVTGDTTNDKWLGYLFLWTCLSAGYPAIRWPMPRPDSGNVPVVSIPPPLASVPLSP